MSPGRQNGCDSGVQGGCPGCMTGGGYNLDNVNFSIIDFCYCSGSTCSIDCNFHLVTIHCFLCCFDVTSSGRVSVGR